MEEEVNEEEEEEEEEKDGSETDYWATHEETAPSSDEYNSQSEEERDGIDATNTVRYSNLFLTSSIMFAVSRSI